ncbi:hypothetical protein JRQ81_002999, partial [Phrynocephalus forsythii]
EAECAALSQISTKIEIVIQFLEDLCVFVHKPVVVFEDNQTCIHMAPAEVDKAKTKHVSLKYQNVKDAVQRKMIELKYCPSEDIVADILTKALGSEKHYQIMEKLGLVEM